MAYTFKHGDRPLEGYTIQRAVGSGGFGQVYYALSDGGREVALKYLKDNPQVELRGVSHCINLKSPHLISIFDVRKNAEDEYFLVMEYCSGPSLRDLLIAAPNGFGPQKAAFFVREIAKGLAYLHDRGIVHRDLKPGNIFFDDGYVKIGDYGLSKFISISRHSAQTASVGTVHYMAPEIGSGNYSRGVDIYALGVIFYEMLLGRVPFEGCTMGEVLMKHLTTQPAVDELPHPFANVIRRALLKDPNDRYQNVNEMMDELLAVDDVQKSLAGFSVKSLEGAVRMGQADTLPSPMPSPNPTPRFAGIPQPRPLGPPPVPYALSARLTKKFDKISRKIDRKMEKLGGRRGTPGLPTSPAAETWPRQAPDRPSPGPYAPDALSEPHSRRKRMILCCFMTLGLATALGVLVGNAMGNDEAGVSASMLVVAMWGGILLTRKATRWFAVEWGPGWSQKMVGFLCCAPLLSVAAAPVLDRVGNDALGLLIGLVAVAVLTKWEREFSEGARGELRLGSAVRAAIFAVIVTGISTAIFDGDDPSYMPIAAGVAGVVSLCLQPTAWWLSGRASQAAGLGGMRAAPYVASQDLPANQPPAIPTPQAPSPPPSGSASLTGPGQASVLPQVAAGPPARWAVTRAFWGLGAFLTMAGAIVTFLVPLILNLDRTSVAACVTACVAFTALTAFALRKTTPFRRETFWLETLRPFLFAASFFGIGAAIVGLAAGPIRFEEQYEVGFPSAPTPPDECEDAPEVPVPGITVVQSFSEGKRKKAENFRRKTVHFPEKIERWSAKLERFPEKFGISYEPGIWGENYSGNHKAVFVTGLVFSGIIFLFLTATMGRRRKTRPFLQPGATDSGGAPSTPSLSGPATNPSAPQP